MVFELDPEEVEDVLRVTAMALAFPSLTPEPWSSSNRRPITGVCQEDTKAGTHQNVYSSVSGNSINFSCFLTSEMSKVKSRVFPGRALDEPSHTLLTSRLDRSPWEWPYTGWTRLAERDTTSFKMFKASFQCMVCWITNTVQCMREPAVHT